jgi:riboflavin kinase/FMN adenylyltransferase
VIVFDDPAQVPQGFGPSVVAIGKFDGVHSGHRAVVARARIEAEGAHAQVVAVTFDRNPLSVLRPELCPEPLVSLAQKLDLLAAEGVDATLVLRFDAELAAISAREFVERFLVGALGAGTVMVGDDFRFGRGGEGDPHVLTTLGAELGFEVDVVGDVQGAGRRVSSTWIRELLQAGDVEGAARLLKRGRELGFPTANLTQDAEGFVPADGIYAGWLLDEGPVGVSSHSVTRYPAAISVGTNPTFDDVPVRQVEAYVLDETALDLYGHRVEVQFTNRIRGMVAFEGVDALREQIADDVRRVRDALRA